MKYYTKIILLLYQTENSHIYLLHPDLSYHCLSAFYAWSLWAPPRKLPSSFRHGEIHCEWNPNPLMNEISHRVWLWCQEIWFGVVCIFSCLSFHPLLSWEKVKSTDFPEIIHLKSCQFESMLLHTPLCYNKTYKSGVSNRFQIRMTAVLNVI